MAQGTNYQPNTTRGHWGGAASDIDQHLELYTGIVDSRFDYTQIFSGLSSQRTTEDRTNTVRLDRMNTSKVKGRKAGEAINSQRVTSDKLNIIVECMMYIRNPIDWMDDWTAPDVLTEMGRNNGTEFGLAFDEAHIIRLQKARSWVAPAHLKPAFNDGMSINIALAAAPTTDAQLVANAQALVIAHAKMVEKLTKRHVPLQDMVTLVSPEVFTELLNHPKLINKDYVADNGDFAGRKVVQVNGIPVVQSTAFPTAPVTNHILSTAGNGNAFNATADDIKGEMIIFSKALSLVTVTAKPFTSNFWVDNAEMCNVLDCYTMFTIDVRRPDTVGVGLVTRT